MQKQNGKRASWPDFLAAIKPSQSCAKLPIAVGIITSLFQPIRDKLNQHVSFSPALWVSKMKSQQIWQWNEKGTQISNSDALLLSSKRRVWESSVDTWTSPLPARYVAFSWEPIIPKAMDLLQLTNHVVQNRHTGEQMTHWDMLNKENSNLVAFFNMSQCVILYYPIAQLQKAHSTEPALRAGKVS